MKKGTELLLWLAVIGAIVWVICTPENFVRRLIFPAPNTGANYD